MSNIEKILQDRGYSLDLPDNVNAYVGYTVAGNLVIISGQLPMKDGKPQYIGKLGKDISFEDAQNAARLCLVNIIAQLKKACAGDLGRVKQALRLGVLVNATEDYTEHPKVANAASEMLVELFGENGKHARAAYGTSGLPLGVAVEIEAMFEIA
jgi:enamine deaminase RidA (YjgF/YER057c/UK114 family)